MRLLILGAGVSGVAAARLGRRLGHSATVHDASAGAGTALIGEGIAVVNGRWEPDLLGGIDLVVTSPGIPLRAAPITDAREAGIPVWSELEFAWRHLESPVVAVTGTNGKTTVTEAAAAMLAASGLSTAAVGNIGTALSSVVGESFDVLVVEASSFQLELTDSVRPDTAVLLNLAPDHLDWHPSYAAYAAAKAKIFANQEGGDLLVYDADDPGVEPLVTSIRARHNPPRLWPVSGNRRPAGGSGPADGVLRLPGVEIPLTDLASPDPILVVDLAAAAVAASNHGARPEAVTSVCRRFRPGPHRRTVVAERGGVAFVDDSKATNPHAALASISAYSSVVLIAGGISKGLDISPLAQVAHVRHVVALGESAPVLVKAAGPGRATMVDSMEEAVAVATGIAQPGDTVLLAPGCASFDMFESYGARGDSFASAVKRLVSGGAA
ncbi:MAG: UDP-N-acetylmuramoyl-L-alanine--D-glutamate ligase [Acidimicrobiia bacterium]|nr:UDP-N-acetylmuramoyl-L-alanine--D-glutamate ligase [Acidimicrobiia bacterium]